MKLETQVCSLELAKRLKELGVKQESLYYWCENSEGASIQWGENLTGEIDKKYQTSAFTVAKLGEMLPEIIQQPRATWELLTYKHNNTWRIGYQRIGMPSVQCESLIEYIQTDTEANVRAKMLAYLIENKLMEVRDDKRRV